ncbi:hypothetical protein OHA74_11960 [Streptomyces phaeochromogenes]|uniref:hypothetical protein n=1 Tax=Streptomyces phaeochromogenes TaxID=1923 RepID=UPI002E2AE552|nr:hypothetical protein [Streptomyces phaeochromogenes]
MKLVEHLFLGPGDLVTVVGEGGGREDDHGDRLRSCAMVTARPWDPSGAVVE